jgi:hypothetical protein
MTPNPVRPPVELHVTFPPLADGGRLMLLDASGRRVRTLLEPTRPGGRSVWWDGRDDLGHRVGPGVYLARVKYPGGEATRKVVVLP